VRQWMNSLNWNMPCATRPATFAASLLVGMGLYFCRVDSQRVVGAQLARAEKHPEKFPNCIPAEYTDPILLYSIGIHPLKGQDGTLNSVFPRNTPIIRYCIHREYILGMAVGKKRRRE
jgi:hypothetical protein